MTTLQELEASLKQKQQKTENTLLNTIGSTFSLGMEEMKKSMGGVFSVKSGEKGQISTELDKWENELIEARKEAV